MLLQLMVMAVAGAGGVLLFYIQHQFEAAYWERGDGWDDATAALQASSFYQLPKFLQWFSGNIGFHHTHHLSPRIPYYNLQRCHEAEPLFLQVKPITLLSSRKKAKRLVGYGRMRQLRQQQKDACKARHQPPKRS